MDFNTAGSFDHYASAIAAATPKELIEGHLLRRLAIRREGSLTACYAPFDFVAPDARLVIVGITPGRTQAVTALVAASEALRAGKHPNEASRLAKVTGSFSGSMRVRLVSMLDHIGLAAALGLASCADLFDSSSEQVHFTSALRYPVFVGDANYNGKPDMLQTPLLRSMIDSCLTEEARCLSKAVWLPLGPEPARAVHYLCEQGLLDRKQVLQGLPHPSGANAERISYFLGRKPRHLLSSRTNASTLDTALDRLCLQVQALSANAPVSAPAA
ncbi:uracil-DNA glycosylase family protein [Bradyrhizobium ottawaense]